VGLSPLTSGEEESQAEQGERIRQPKVIIGGGYPPPRGVDEGTRRRRMW